jgi:hypothetical protein
MTVIPQSKVFPLVPPRDFAASFADEPILVDGMKVVFDVKVALYPVSLKKPERESADGGRGAGDGA